MLRIAARSLCMPSLSKAASISDEEIVPLESASNACSVYEPADAQAVAKARIPSNHATVSTTRPPARRGSRHMHTLWNARASHTGLSAVRLLMLVPKHCSAHAHAALLFANTRDAA